MSDDSQHIPMLPDFDEEIERSADELTDLIAMKASSIEEVPTVIEGVLNCMRNRLLSVDWSVYKGHFGPETTRRDIELTVRAMLEGQDEPPTQPPPIDWSKRNPPPNRRDRINPFASLGKEPSTEDEDQPLPKLPPDRLKRLLSQDDEDESE